MPQVTLADGLLMPMIGLGTWQLDDSSVGPVVLDALELGYRHIDTASRYGNESGIGRALAASGLRRQDCFVTTKLRGADHNPALARTALEGSLDRLGLSYVDLYLIHWPMPALGKYRDVWQVMLELRSAGLARSVGVSNFTAEHVAHLIEDTGTRPALDQIQCSPELPRRALRADLSRLGVPVASWRPLGSRNLHDDPTIAAFADQRRCSPAQLILRWHLAQGLSVTPKSANRKRLAENLDILTSPLTSAEMAAIDRSVPRATDEPVDVDVMIEM
jgi:2,5-diketo-D-gluconate reductase A